MGPFPRAETLPGHSRSPALYVALSGGGFRATAHHMGVLLAFLRHNVHHEVMTVSGVSGGAVAGAGLLMWWDEWLRRPINGLEALRAFANPLVNLMRSNLRGRFLLPAVFRSSRAVEKQLDRVWLRGKLLQKLNVLPPLFVFPSTDLSSGAPFYFTSLGFTSRPHILWEENVANSTRAFSSDDFPLSRAVAASAAFPPVLPPLKIELTGKDLREYLAGRGVVGACTGLGPGESRVGTDRWGREVIIRDPYPVYLTDGGVRDNYGLSFLLELLSRGNPRKKSDAAISIRNVLLFDAGRISSYNPAGRIWRLNLLSRVLEVSSAAKEEQLHSLTHAIISEVGGRFTAIRALPELGPQLGLDPDVLSRALQVRTDLDRFTDTEMYVLASMGYRSAVLGLHIQGLIPASAMDKEEIGSDFKTMMEGVLEPLPEKAWSPHLAASGSRWSAWRHLARNPMQFAFLAASLLWSLDGTLLWIYRDKQTWGFLIVFVLLNALWILGSLILSSRMRPKSSS